MNQTVYLGLLEPGNTILAMDLLHGGHVTHGAPVSHMGQLADWITACLRNHENADNINEVRVDVEASCRKFSVPGLV